MTKFGTAETIHQMRQLRCCTNCFAHEWLRGYVEENATRAGTCNYCRRKKVDLIAVGDLYDLFNNALGAYLPSEDPHGERLISLLQDDFGVFAEKLYESGKAASLLEDILDAGWDDDDGEPHVGADDLYYPASSHWSHDTMAEKWTDFCARIKAKPSTVLDLPELFEEDAASLGFDLLRGTILYRARPGFVVDDCDGRTRAHEGSAMGAPTPEQATPGRANTEGEVVLYLADQERVAVAEMRPARGLRISVAEVTPKKDLHILDLSRLLEPVNPFVAEPPHYWLEFGELLAALGEELSRPLRRSDDLTDYRPSQALVRRIREGGLFDGIRYPSAMAPPGTNLVLFDPSVVTIGVSWLVEVHEVSVAYDIYRAIGACDR